jgi:hypothetical protein
MDLPETDFAFEFDGGTVVDSSEFTARVVRKNTESYGGFFDVVTLDMGWSAPRSIWQVDKTSFPQGLTN